MTHDELLAKLNSYQCGSAFAEMFKNALRAVVELHQPKKYRGYYWCTGCQADFAESCPTIQAIEKELI